MSAIHVVARTTFGHGNPSRPNPLGGLFDVGVDGVNVAARVGENQALATLADFGLAVADLTIRPSQPSCDSALFKQRVLGTGA